MIGIFISIAMALIALYRVLLQTSKTTVVRAKEDWATAQSLITPVAAEAKRAPKL